MNGQREADVVVVREPPCVGGRSNGTFGTLRVSVYWTCLVGAPVDCIPELQDAVCRLDVYIFCSSLVS